MFRPVGPAVQESVRAALAALTTVPGSVGYPTGGVADEQLWLPGEFEETTVRAVSGYAQRDVTGSVEVRVLVTRTTDRWTDSRDRALELAALVEDMSWPTPRWAAWSWTAWSPPPRCQEAHPEEHVIQAGLTVALDYPPRSPRLKRG